MDNRQVIGGLPGQPIEHRQSSPHRRSYKAPLITLRYSKSPFLRAADRGLHRHSLVRRPREEIYLMPRRDKTKGLLPQDPLRTADDPFG